MSFHFMNGRRGPTLILMFLISILFQILFGGRRVLLGWTAEPELLFAAGGNFQVGVAQVTRCGDHEDALPAVDAPCDMKLITCNDVAGQVLPTGRVALLIAPSSSARRT